MSCDEHRQQLGLVLDGEGEWLERAGLFAHLEACPECRQFLDALVRVRRAAQRDREEMLREAEEALPAAAPLPGAIGGGAAESARRGSRLRAGAWLRPLVPAPAALALGALLLVAGIAIGSRLAARREVPRVAPQVETGGSSSEDLHVVYLCSMPEVKVTAKPLPPDRR